MTQTIGYSTLQKLAVVLEVLKALDDNGIDLLVASILRVLHGDRSGCGESCERSAVTCTTSNKTNEHKPEIHMYENSHDGQQTNFAKRAVGVQKK